MTEQSAYKWVQGPDYAPALRAELRRLEAELPALEAMVGRAYMTFCSAGRIAFAAESLVNNAYQLEHKDEQIAALRSRIEQAEAEASNG